VFVPVSVSPGHFATVGEFGVVLRLV